MSQLQQAYLKAKEWIQDQAVDPADRQFLQKLVDQKNDAEILESFYKDLEFGTGGLRAIMGLGSNRFNKYTVRKATQALATNLNKFAKSKGDPQTRVAISFDSRNGSLEFAKEVAGVMAANNVHVFLYEYMTPVALLSFSVRYHKAHGGVMVTASHNPPKYNGYKVYWADGAQVTPPYDQEVINTYYSIKSFQEVRYMDYEAAKNKGLITLIGKDVEDAYFEKLRPKFVNPGLCHERGKELKIVYTPIHGTGLKTCQRVLKEMGFSQVLVPPMQAMPDGNFPTVSSPNPENPDALAMAVELMLKEQADIVFGTDPDTDRLGVAIVADQKQKKIFYPNGNQIGLLMLYYMLTNLKEQGKLPANPYFVKTIVTSELQAKIAQYFGLTVENTLTGFKWICGRMGEIERHQPERNFVFATEESFGYMTHNFVRDKDGICSVAIMAELALWYKTQGLNLIQALDKIYTEFGFSDETLVNMVYEGKDGAEKINRIMDHFRKNVRSSFIKEKIVSIEDYETQEITNTVTGKISPLNLPKSNVLGYSFASGTKLYLRPSGTEPKIKFYIMISVTEGSLEDKKSKAKNLSDAFVEAIHKEVGPV
jgi:phosphoglucomutase